MYYLLIDTADWIDLPLKLPKVLKKIEELIASDRIALVLPQTIIDEWNRKKVNRVVVPWQTSKRDAAKKAKQILDLLPETESKELRQSLNLYWSDEETFNLPIVGLVKTVDTLFSHPSTILLNISTDTKLKSVDFALAKKAPFQNKNSMADALILFSYIEFVAGEPNGDYMFVSKNTRDFADSESKGKEEVHSDLTMLFEEYQIRYFSNIGKAINEIEKGLLDSNVVEEIERIHDVEESFRRFTEVNAATLAAYQESIGANAAMKDMMKTVKDFDQPAIVQMQELVSQNAAALVAIQETVGANAALMDMMKPARDLDQATALQMQELVSQNAASLVAIQETVGANAAFIDMMKTIKDIDQATVLRLHGLVSQNASAFKIFQDSIRPGPEIAQLIEQLSSSALEFFEDVRGNIGEEE